jgi:type IV pilus assembly protein PilO
MAKITDLPVKAQLGIVLGLAVAITAGLYYTVYKAMDDQNRASRAALKSKLDEIAQLKPYEAQKTEMEQKIASYNQQLESLNRIVPEEKEAPQFMQSMQAEAARAGIEIRRYTALPTSQREFFSEVPFSMDLDGPYYSLLKFFEDVSKMDRIVNMTGLKMATVKAASRAGVKQQYAYAPTESVVVSATATTFYSRPDAGAAAAPKK